MPFDVAESQSLAALVDQGIEFSQQHPGRKYKTLIKGVGGKLLDAAHVDTAAFK